MLSCLFVFFNNLVHDLIVVCRNEFGLIIGLNITIYFLMWYSRDHCKIITNKFC